MAQFFQTFTAAGNSDTQTAADGSFFANGTFNGATVNLQFTVDNGSTWHTIHSLSAAGIVRFDLGVGFQLRINVTGSPTSITAGI